jgi:ligand-binding sensor domain-containing protein
MLPKRNNHLLLLVLICFIGNLNCLAQLQKSYYFHNYNEQNGLIAKYNTFFHTDSRGFLWISSTEGLNRFDGQTVKRYLSNRTDSTTLYDNNIQSPFFEDKKGNIWFCTYEAIHRYNRQRDAFERYWISVDGKRIENNYYVFALDSENCLWFRNGSWNENSSLYRVQIDTLNGSTLNAQNVCIFQGLRSIIIQEDQRKIIVLTYPSNTGFGFVKYIIDKKNNSIKQKAYLTGENSGKIKIKSLVLEKDKKLWLATDKGLVLFHLDTGRSQLFNDFETEKIDDLLGLASWQDDKLIMTTREKGVLFFNKNKLKYFERIETNKLKTLTDGLCASIFGHIYVDSMNNLWLTGYQSACLNHINLNKIKFSFLPSVKDLNKEFSNSIEDSLRNIWVSYSDMGIFVFNPKGEIIKRFDSKYFIDNKVRHFYKDDKGCIWILTDHQILKSEKGAYTLQSVHQSLEIFFNKIGQLENGRLIVLTSKGVYQLLNSQLTPLANLPPQYQALNFKVFAQDSKNHNTYLAENSNSIRVLDSKNQFVLKSEIPFMDDAHNGFLQNEILWLAGNKGLWKVYETQAQGFKSELVLNLPFLYKIYADKKGLLWLSADSGLYTFNPNTKELHKFNASDGLKGTIFSRFTNLSNGDIWLTAYNNINVFNPDSIKRYTNPPKIQITDIKVNDVPYTEGGNVGEISRLELAYSRNTVSLQFVAIEFADPTLNRLKFRLDEYDAEGYWNDVANKDGYIKYFKLPFGTYKMHLKAANGDGVWSEDEKIFIIRINPPWYLSWWGITLEIMTFLGIGWGILQWQLRIQRKKAEMEQKMLMAQMQVLRTQMDPHFLFNVMNSINSYVLQNDRIKASGFLVDFSRLLRKILDFSQKELISLENEAEILRGYLGIEALRFDHRFDFTVTLDPKLDEWDTQLPTMILQPFVENAILHGIGGKKEGRGLIQVRFEADGATHFRCIVEDNGIGRPKNGVKNSDTALTKHESKAMQITNERLELFNLKYPNPATLNIIDLVNDKQEGIGTRIELRFPIL